MKKFLCVLTVLLIMISSSVHASVCTAEYTYDSVNNGFVVSGTLTDTKIGDEITVEAYFNDEMFDSVVTVTEKKDGASYYESELIGIDGSRDSGKIKFKIYSANNVLNLETAEFNYYGIDTVYPILKSVILSGSYYAIKEIIKVNDEKLGIEFDEVSSLGSAAEAVMDSYVKNLTYALPSDISSKENKLQVFGELIKFRENYKNMAMLGNFTDAENQTEFLKWFSDYKEILKLEEYNIGLYEYFEKNYADSDYFKILCSQSRSFSVPSTLKDRLLEVGALVNIKSGNTASTKKVFDSFLDKITISYNLSDAQKTSVYQTLSGMEFASFDKLSEKYNSLAYDILYPKTVVTPSFGGSSGGGSTGGSVSFTPSTPVTTPSDEKDVEEAKEIFSDMKSAEWAKKAVYALYEKGIVSGRSENTFDPNTNITRAEFVKLIVLIKNNFKAGTSQIFTDVNENDWYFDYVNNAYIGGIATGYADGSFCPENNITRQDMAVLIYRYLNSPAASRNLSEFSDGEAVSDYAKDAVSYLSDSGIVKGMGDGNFAPLSNATRAQAAQIIYNIIK